MPPPRSHKSKPGKKASSSKPQKSDAPSSSSRDAPILPLDLQQLVLNIFKTTFTQRLESDIQPLLQEVKGHLYRRDFLAAFGRPEYLEAYAARWSPSRALGYLQILEGLKTKLGLLGENGKKKEEEGWKVVCLGGGAGAEIVALGALSERIQEVKIHGGDENGDEKAQDRPRKIQVTAVDIADWKEVTASLTQSIVSKPPLSRYASAATKAASKPLADAGCFDVAFQQLDVLNAPSATALAPLLHDANLVTLMFTLNELYSASISLTQQFLVKLTHELRPGAWLLVVDSPGSYSSVSLNGTEKKYPMQWLLDHTLLGKGAKLETELLWEKIEEEESRWFRLDEKLSYPIELENMRFQIHLYRRIGGVGVNS